MEDIDYMSDEFLKGAGSNDVRPGVPKTHSQQRQFNQLKKKKISDEKCKKLNLKDVQTECLKQGLQQPISSSNKGFTMLEKMGFKPGTGLGKSNTGIVEPVDIKIKNNRMGLGRAEALEQIKIKKEQMMMRHLQQTTNVDEFRNIQSKKIKERQTRGDLRKSQRMCHQLDTQVGIDSPVEVWFWPKVEPVEEEPQEEEECETEECCLDESEQLELLTGYLRNMFCYCMWCSVQYEDEKDLQACPGCTRDDH